MDVCTYVQLHFMYVCQSVIHDKVGGCIHTNLSKVHMCEIETCTLSRIQHK